MVTLTLPIPCVKKDCSSEVQFGPVPNLHILRLPYQAAASFGNADVELVLLDDSLLLLRLNDCLYVFFVDIFRY